MLKVKHNIESQTMLEASSKARRDRLCHIFLIIGFLAFMGLNAYIRAIRYFGDKAFYINYIKIIDTIIRTVKGCFDIFMHILFIKIFLYFLKFKNERKPRLPSNDKIKKSFQ